MADTVELERIMVRFFADAAPLIDSMKQAKQATQDYGTATDQVGRLEEAAMSTRTKIALQIMELNKVMATGALSQQAYAKEMDKLQKALNPSIWDRSAKEIIGQVNSYAGAAIQGVRGAVDLMKGDMNSTGESLGKLGDMANLIPGPWGQAASAVLRISGSIADLFEGPLNRAKEAAKNAFESIASGARTTEQAIHDIGKRVMSEQLDKAVDRAQESAIGHGLQNLGLRDTSSEVLARTMTMIQQRRTLMQQLLSSPEMTRQRVDMAVEDVTQGLQDRPREMEMHAVRRRQMMAMHRPTRGPEEQANAERLVETETRRLTIMELQRRVGRGEIDDARAELILRQGLAENTRAMIENMRRHRAERIEEQLAHATTQHVTHLREQVDVTTRLRSTQAGAGDIRVKAMEAQQKIERELQALREQGATRPQVSQRREQLEAENNQRLLNEAMQDGIHITTQMQSPLDTYNQRLEHLQIRLDQGVISHRAYAEAVATAGQTLNHATPEIQAYVREVDAGVALVARFANPMDQFITQQRQLDEAFYAGRVTLEERAITLERLQRQLDGVNSSMQGVTATERGSAASFRAIGSYLQGLRIRAEEPGLQSGMRNRAEQLGAGGGGEGRGGFVGPQMPATVAAQREVQRFAEAAQEASDAMQGVIAGMRQMATQLGGRLELPNNVREAAGNLLNNLNNLPGLGNVLQGFGLGGNGGGGAGGGGGGGILGQIGNALAGGQQNQAQQNIANGIQAMVGLLGQIATAQVAVVNPVQAAQDAVANIVQAIGLGVF